MTEKAHAPSDDVTAHVVGEITKRFADAVKPVVIVDACAGRFGMSSTVRKLVESCGVRFFESEQRIPSIRKTILAKKSTDIVQPRWAKACWMSIILCTEGVMPERTVLMLSGKKWKRQTLFYTSVP